MYNSLCGSLFIEVYMCDIIDCWDLLLTFSVEFKLKPKPLNEWKKYRDGQSLNSRSIWNHGSDLMVSVRWPKCF